jgi:UDP-N-acetylglucosamine diphosphorylase/glucosamine-1-phosphate N-acetyltransferase
MRKVRSFGDRRSFRAGRQLSIEGINGRRFRAGIVFSLLLRTMHHPLLTNFVSMAIVLFDNPNRNHLFPLTYTRAVAGLRFGILTIKERWEMVSNQPVFIHTEKYLQELYDASGDEEHTWIDASVIADEALTEQILTLSSGSCITDEQGLIAGRIKTNMAGFLPAKAVALFEKSSHATARRLTYPWQLMLWNDEMTRTDYALVTKNRVSCAIPSTVNTIAPGDIFIEPGAKLSYCTLNASTGPIYLGKDSEVMEGSAVRGPFVLGEGAVLKLNSRVYGATTLGPLCLGGGEIKNSILMGYSNKAHDGYLGDSVVGEWCNFGAGSTNSNIKNTAGEVKIWNMAAKEYMPAGQKCGVIMGDYSRVAINSSINTGTVIGIGSNVFGAGLLPTIIANFRWGVSGTEYEFQKAVNDINNWKKLKGNYLSNKESLLLRYIFDLEKTVV